MSNQCEWHKTTSCYCHSPAIKQQTNIDSTTITMAIIHNNIWFAESGAPIMLRLYVYPIGTLTKVISQMA